MKNRVINFVIVALLFVSIVLLPTIAFAEDEAVDSGAKATAEAAPNNNDGDQKAVQMADGSGSNATTAGNSVSSDGSQKPDSETQDNTDDPAATKEDNSAPADTPVSETDTDGADSAGDVSLGDEAGISVDDPAFQGYTSGLSGLVDMFKNSAIINAINKFTDELRNSANLKPWSSGNLKPWSNGNLKPWSNGNLKPWSNGNLKPWSNGNLIPWDSIIRPWSSGNLLPWIDDIINPWSNGNLYPWSNGNLYPWSNGNLYPWSNGDLRPDRQDKQEEIVQLSFETNGGMIILPENYQVGTIVVLDMVPEREGYIFTGWYSDKELTRRVKKILIVSNIKIYAGWEKIGETD